MRSLLLITFMLAIMCNFCVEMLRARNQGYATSATIIQVDGLDEIASWFPWKLKILHLQSIQNHSNQKLPTIIAQAPLWTSAPPTAIPWQIHAFREGKFLSEEDFINTTHFFNLPFIPWKLKLLTACHLLTPFHAWQALLAHDMPYWSGASVNSQTKLMRPSKVLSP